MGISSPLPSELEDLSRALIDSAFKVHRSLGPGLLESVYQACLCIELSKRGIDFESQAPVPITYDGVRLEAGLRLDLLVERSLIVEIKAIHQSQLLTYLKLSELRLGLLINFNVVLFKQGVKRLIR